MLDRGDIAVERRRPGGARHLPDISPFGLHHVAGNVWQHSGLPGGVQVESRGKDATLGDCIEHRHPTAD